MDGCCHYCKFFDHIISLFTKTGVSTGLSTHWRFWENPHKIPTTSYKTLTIILFLQQILRQNKLGSKTQKLNTDTR
jgi:hypothetical protein